MVAACGKKEGDEIPALTVYAAAGTAPAMKEIGRAFTEKTGVPVVFNFANAGALAKQICAGGDANIFFSANEKWMDYVEKAGKTDPATRDILLQDTMVIIVPKGKSLDVDFTKPRGDQQFTGRFSIGDQSTPLGIYARQAFMKLGWWGALQAQLSVADVISKVLNYVVLDEADAGVVFRSVAVSAGDKVDIVGEMPTDLHAPIRFPIAACTLPHLYTDDFLQFVKGPEAEADFKKYGWTLYKGE
jgi:molybdate transport system substrate-binding protein